MEFTREQKLVQQIVHKAWEDAAFKKELVENPIATIENLTGEKVNLPEGKTLVVRDQTEESAVYINIPSEPNMDDVELNESQLEAVAGGNSIVGPVYCCPPDDIFGGSDIPKTTTYNPFKIN